jgi:NADH dehydrogenase (ubiquinone) 1 beta subcomplex subunit 5
MVIIPSRYQWQKYKDLFHFYFMLGALPLLALVFYVNVFIGPATLAEIPEGTKPNYWEYERVIILNNFDF